MRSFIKKTRVVNERNKSNGRTIAGKLVKGALSEEVMWTSAKPEGSHFDNYKNKRPFYIENTKALKHVWCVPQKAEPCQFYIPPNLRTQTIR